MNYIDLIGLVIILALCVPVMPAQNEITSPCMQQGIVGNWSWVNNEYVIANRDGSLLVYDIGSPSKPYDTGTWVQSDASKKVYTLSWSKGAIDILTLSSDCKILEGTNNANQHVIGTRNMGVTAPTPNKDIKLQSRTEYILDDLATYRPGVLVELSSWNGTIYDELVPDTPIYIRICEEGSKDPCRTAQVTTSDNGYVFYKWIFKNEEMGKHWIIYFSPDPNDYEAGIVTGVSSYIPDDLSAFTKESEIARRFPGWLVDDGVSNNKFGVPI